MASISGPTLLIFLLASLVAILLPLVSSHGRLFEPPNRSSLWRFAEFDRFSPPLNYEDNQLFCGGVVLIHIQLTAVHLELRLCPLISEDEIQDESCFQENILQCANGHREYLVDDEEVQEYFLQAWLPTGVRLTVCGAMALFDG